MSEKSRVFLPAIFNTIKTGKQTVAEGVDVLAKLATDSEFLKEIPVISTAVKVLNIKDVFTQHRLERNCIAFLKAAADSGNQAMDDLREKIQADSEYAKDFTDTILSVLIEGQKPIKSELIGRLVVALSVRKITFEEFQAMSQIIQTASPPALRALPSFFESTNGVPYIGGTQSIAEEPLLFSLGIAYRSGKMFRISDLGTKLYAHGFGGRLKTA